MPNELESLRSCLFAPEASTTAVTSSDFFGCFRLEQQLPSGISSSHWSNAPFSWRTEDFVRIVFVGLPLINPSTNG